LNNEVNTATVKTGRGGFKGPVEEELRKLRMPALLVHGRGDPRPVWPVEVLQTSCRGRNSTWFPDVGHEWHEDPESLRQILKEFLMGCM
jgi:pimeloyl-ACP methyl ester carboxylesterase